MPSVGTESWEGSRGLQAACRARRHVSTTVPLTRRGRGTNGRNYQVAFLAGASGEARPLASSAEKCEVFFLSFFNNVNESHRRH